MPLTTLQLRILLKEIKNGKTRFSSEGDAVNDRDVFHYKARLLAIADQNGYLQGYYPLYLDATDGPLLDLIVVKGLSPVGEQFLSNPFKVCPDL